VFLIFLVSIELVFEVFLYQKMQYMMEMLHNSAEILNLIKYQVTEL